MAAAGKTSSSGNGRWHHVRDRIEDGSEFRLRREERQNPGHETLEDEIHRGGASGRPGNPSRHAESHQPDRESEGADFVKRRGVLEIGRGELHDEDAAQREKDAADVNKKPIAQGVVGAILIRQPEQQRAEIDAQHPETEEGMRRADDLDIETVGIVPPVVERRRREHGDRAPHYDPRAERRARPEDAHGGGTLPRAGEKGVPKGQPSAHAAAEEAAEVNGQVGGVQNVSRPMVMCQEISQIMPTTMLVVARASSQPGQ